MEQFIDSLPDYYELSLLEKLAELPRSRVPYLMGMLNSTRRTGDRTWSEMSESNHLGTDSKDHMV